MGSRHYLVLKKNRGEQLLQKASLRVVRDFGDRVARSVEGSHTPDDTRAVYLQVWEQTPPVYREVIQLRYTVEHFLAVLYAPTTHRVKTHSADLNTTRTLL
ncbi:hypothetical protein BGZ49_008031 [Haplosporangium sp. Z 27]|nr:hypothetical protein BGZ49_008031 [Haplosporangium sp. Z 27]